MPETFRSGNSRLLAKTLDQLGHPLAVLDRKGVVVFANEPLCGLIGADATQLVGQSCSWQVAEDDTPFASLLTALAPPAGALQGKVVTRQLTTPILYGSPQTGQLFIPLLEADGSVQATLVMLGQWEQIQAQLPIGESQSMERRRHYEQTLVHIRSRWSTLDGLFSLLGKSPAIELAMSRSQLAIRQPCNIVVAGPRNIGKTELVRSLFAARLKQANLQKLAGQLFPLACGILDDELFAGMLELFTDRLRPGSPRTAQLLVLEEVEKLTPAALLLLNDWLDRRGNECFVAAVSRSRVDELSRQGEPWQKLMSRLATLEIVLPGLRERREDIVPLAQHLLAVACRQKERGVLTISAEAQQLLTAFPWPENLAQLAGAIDEAVNHAVLTSTIQVAHLPVVLRTFPSTAEQSDTAHVEPIDLDQVLLDLERLLLQRAIKLSPRNRAQVARLLGISRPRLLRRIEQLGLDD